MADRGGVTGSFVWTPPTGNIPPFTITKVLTMDAPTVIANSYPVEPTEFEVSLVPLESESSTPTTTSVPTATQTTTITKVILPSHPIAFETTLNAPPDNISAPSTRTNNLDSLTTPLTSTLGSSTWTTSFKQTSQAPEIGTTTSDSTLPLKTLTQALPPGPMGTGAPPGGLSKITLIGISVGGGAVFVATIIGLIIYIRFRKKDPESKRNNIKNKIGNPVQPIVEKRLSDDNQNGWLFQGIRDKHFSQGSQAALVARSATNSTGTGSQGPSSPSYSNTFPQVQITPSSPHGLLGQASGLVQETTTSFGLSRPSPRTVRPVSSVYVDTLDNDIYGVPSIYGAMNLRIGAGGERDSNYPPYLNQAMPEVPQMSSGNPYRNTGNPYRDTQVSYSVDSGNSYAGSGLLHVPSSQSRNLMVPNPTRRRNRPVSSWMSNNYYEAERMGDLGSERSSLSDFTSVFGGGTGGQRACLPTLRPLASSLNSINEGGHRFSHGAPVSAYGDSILGYYENNSLEEVREITEGITASTVGERGTQQDGEDGGNTGEDDPSWEQQRRVLFESK